MVELFRLLPYFCTILDHSSKFCGMRRLSTFRVHWSEWKASGSVQWTWQHRHRTTPDKTRGFGDKPRQKNRHDSFAYSILLTTVRFACISFRFTSVPLWRGLCRCSIKPTFTRSQDKENYFFHVVEISFFCANVLFKHSPGTSRAKRSFCGRILLKMVKFQSKLQQNQVNCWSYRLHYILISLWLQKHASWFHLVSVYFSTYIYPNICALLIWYTNNNAKLNEVSFVAI